MFSTPSSSANRFATSRKRSAKNFMRAALVGCCLAALAACSSPEQKVAKYTKSGEEYLEEGRLPRASIQFQNALKIDEEHVPALVGLAKVAELRQNYKQMFAALQRVVRLDPENVGALVQLGKLYLVGSDETQALENADKALALQPEYPDAVALKAAVLLKLEDNVQAVELAKKALALDPANAEAVTVLATERSRAKDYEGAIGYLDGALSVNSKQAVLHLLRLQMLKNLGRDDEVLEGHLRLINEFPENAGYRRVYVGTLLKAKRLDEAREQLVDVAKLLPKEVDPVLDVIRVDYRIGGDEKAAATFKQYAEERSDNVDLQFAYAGYLRQQGDYEGSGAIYSALADEKDKPDVVLRARNEIAGQLLVEGKKDEAEKILDDIVSKDERNSDALLKLSGLKIDRGELDEAIRDLRVVLDDDPQSAPARMLMATAFERQGDVALAASQMSQAVVESDYEPKQSNVFAKFLIRNNEQTRAENILVESLSKHPADLDNLKFLAAIRLLKQDWRGAEEVAKIIDNINDDDPVVNRILGAAYTGLEDYSGVIDALEEENQRTPLASRPLETLIGAYMRTDREVEAEALLRENIRNNPENYSARMLLSRVLLQQRKDDEARGVLETAIEKSPTQFEGYERLFRLHNASDRREEAVALIDRGLKAAPESDGMKIIKADILLSENREEEAMAIYEEILERRPDDQLVANNYVSLLTKLRDDNASRERAVAIAEVLDGVENPYFQDTYGWALVQNGSLAKGLPMIEKAVELLPSLAEARYHLGATLLRTGDTERGKKELRKAIEDAGDEAGFVEDARALLAD
ncbi:MAG: tetratricopeptide repeat protein [Pseudomonadota bacterium]